jgi:hypothetical protein
MPDLVSSNWAAWILGLATFALTEVLLYLSTPREERSQRWARNLLIGVAVTAFVYFTLFIWSTVQTVYDNHHDSVMRWQAVVVEKNTLKDTLRKRDDYIHALKGKTQDLQGKANLAPKVVEKVKTVPKPHQCWMDSIWQDPSPYIQNARTATTAVVHCNYRIDAPFEVIVQFDQDFLSGNVGLPSAGAVEQSGAGKRPGNVFFAEVDSPSLPANQLVTVVIQSSSKQFPHAIAGSVKSK